MKIFYRGAKRGQRDHVVYDQKLNDKNITFLNEESYNPYAGFRVTKLKNGKLQLTFGTYMDHDPNGMYIFKIEFSKKELLLIMKNELKNTRVKDLLV